MTTDIVATIVAGILLAVAAFGTIYPILPGSPVALVTLIAWGWILGSTASWTAAGIGAALACAGWSFSVVLTGRRLKRRKIPRGSLTVGALAGIVGMFVIPVAGLFVGFAGGLFVSEYVRQRDARAAGRSSLEVLKAAGLGMVVEFLMVSLAASVWAIGVIVHFVTA
ncbi:MAG: DUF456 domain-containing protein [Actinomycetia bacterium]|nr:DUF456 domain-containing protein [Actinomycetes bacterium]